MHNNVILIYCQRPAKHHLNAVICVSSFKVQATGATTLVSYLSEVDFMIKAIKRVIL